MSFGSIKVVEWCVAGRFGHAWLLCHVQVMSLDEEKVPLIYQKLFKNSFTAPFILALRNLEL